MAVTDKVGQFVYVGSKVAWAARASSYAYFIFGTVEDIAGEALHIKTAKGRETVHEGREVLVVPAFPE